LALLNRKQFLMSLTAAGTASLMSGCDQSIDMAPKTERLNFSILTVDKSANLSKLWEPFLVDMRAQTGLDIQPYYAPDYTSLIEALRFNQVQLGWFSNVPGLEAINRADAEVFVETEYPEGFEGYRSVIITHKDSDITAENLALCDKSINFGMGDPKSTSGTQAPLYYYFIPKGIEPSSCFKTVIPSNHNNNILSVANKIVDAATNNSTALVELKSRQPDIHAKLKVIWESPDLPNDVVIYRRDLKPATKEKLRSFFLAYGRGEGPEAMRQKKILAGLILGGFKPSDNSHFLPIRLMQANTDLLIARQKGDKTAEAKAKALVTSLEAEMAAKAKAPSA
jgi:phosphonate transport system substrate-binding protein